ncbi:MAG: serpin family protein [Ruminococcus sp.]|nr:serpin family protein [Ruminococcus sp.]
MYKKLVASIMSLLLLGLVSCDKVEPITDNPSSTDLQNDFYLSQSMQNDILDFSIDFFKHQIEDDENTIVSPQSLYFALGMTINGANGDTQQELINTLCKGSDLQEFNDNISALINQTDTKTCNIANSIWLRDVQDLSLNSEFKKSSEEYFKSEIYTKKFDGKFVDTVNKWVSKNTDGMIDTILNEVPSEDTMMYLINAICFDAKWNDKYDDVQINENGKFTNSKGDIQDVVMLNSTEDTYLCDEQSTGFLKYYLGGKYAFMGILPNEDVSINDYMESLTGDSFINLYRSKISGNSVSVNVTIPEFKYTSEYLLNDTLKDMGISSAFDEFSADFSNMIDSNTYKLYMGKVIQKAYIQVDRNGTKASAITSISMDNATAMLETYQVYLDRPFIYAIMDTDTELPIFMGVVNNI